MNNLTISEKVIFLLTGGSLVCWLVMFLAGSDVWHDTGRLDFWHLQGPPYHDMRVFVTVFYLLFALLCINMAVFLCRLLHRPKKAE
jgi:hypothetical protein